MNLKEINNKDFLIELKNNKELLISIDEETSGFIYYIFEKNQIYPDIDILMENLNVGSLSFIINNYDLTEEQTNILSDYFYNKNKIVENKEFESENIEKRVINKLPIPQNTILDYKTIYNTQKEIINSIDDNHSFLEILKNSVNKLTKTEILSLKELIKKIPYEIMNSLYHDGEEYTKIYLKNLKKNYKNYNTRDNLLKNVILNDNEEDKLFIKDFLKNYSKSNIFKLNYGMFENVKNFNKLVSPIEFFKEYNREDISILSIEEIKENLEFIQDMFLKNNYSITSFSRYNKINEDKSKLEIIFNKDYFSKLFANDNNLYLSVEDNTIPDSIQIFLKNLSKYVISNPKTHKQINLHNYIHYFKNMNEKELKEFHEGYHKNISYISVNNISKSFLTNNNDFLIKILSDDIFCNNADINKLYLILKITKEDKLLSNDNFTKFLNKVDYEEGNYLLEFFNLDSYKKYLNPKNEIKNSFLSKYDLPKEMEIYLINNKNYLDNKLLKKEKLNNKLLNLIIENDNEEFIKEYIKNHQIENHLINFLLEKEWGGKLLNENLDDKKLLNDFLSNKNKDKPENIRKSVLLEIINDCVAKNNIKKLIKIYKNYSVEKEIYESVSVMKNEDIKKNIKNKDFKNLLKNGLNSYSGNIKNIDLKKEDLILIEDILNTSIMKSIKDKREIIDYLIENRPERFFFVYDRKLKCTADDIINAYNNLEKKIDLFKTENVNENFKERFLNIDFEELKKLIEKAKDYPVLYLILSNYGIRNDKWFEDNKEKSWHEYIVKNFDYNILLDGVKTIVKMFNEIENNENNSMYRYNKNQCVSIIEGFILNTYYEDRDENYNSYPVSILEKEKSEKIIECLIQECPRVLMGRNYVGDIKIKKEEIENILNKKEYDIKKLIFSNVVGEYCRSVDNQDLLDALIDIKIKEKDELSLCFILYCLKNIENTNKFTYAIKNTINYNNCLLNGYENVDYINKLKIIDTKFSITTNLNDFQESVNKRKINKI